MATTGQLARNTADAIGRIRAASEQLAQAAGVSAPAIPTRNKYGVEVLQRDQLIAIADFLENLTQSMSPVQEGDLHSS